MSDIEAIKPKTWGDISDFERISIVKQRYNCTDMATINLGNPSGKFPDPTAPGLYFCKVKETRIARGDDDHTKTICIASDPQASCPKHRVRSLTFLNRLMPK